MAPDKENKWINWNPPTTDTYVKIKPLKTVIITVFYVFKKLSRDMENIKRM